MKNLTVLISAIIFVLLLSSCSDENNPTKPSNLDSKLFGKWVFVDSNNDTYGWTFKDDGSCIQTLYNQNTNWKWSIENEKLKLFVDGGTPAYLFYKIEGNKLFMRADAGEAWGVPYTKQ